MVFFAVLLGMSARLLGDGDQEKITIVQEYNCCLICDREETCRIRIESDTIRHFGAHVLAVAGSGHCTIRRHAEFYRRDVCRHDFRALNALSYFIPGRLSSMGVF